jgi:hypothetical protein
VRGWRVKHGRLPVDDGGDQMERLNDGALACVVPTDNDGVRMKRDRMVFETAIILKTERAHHTGLRHLGQGGDQRSF